MTAPNISRLPEPLKPLQAIMGRILDAQAIADPRELAAVAVDRIPDRDLRHYLELSAVSDARYVLGARRRAAENALRPSASSKRSGFSAKVSGIRSVWSEFLAQNIHVGDQNWIRLADATARDLLFAANERDAHAASVLVQAETYRRLAGLLESSGVATLGEVSEGAATDVIGGLS